MLQLYRTLLLHVGKDMIVDGWHKNYMLDVLTLAIEFSTAVSFSIGILPY